MNGLRKNFDVEECSKKDKMAQDFIKEVNPYRKKPSLGIDLRRLSKYAKENNKMVNSLSESELQNFKIM